MKNRLQEALMNKQENYIFPFFWLHGEDEQKIREYMEKIAETGIRAVCVESRPHPDFLGETWWRDMDIILDEAKKRNMRVWILDDSHFPTGYANGAVKEADDSLKKWHLSCRITDVRGPLQHNRFPVAVNLGFSADMNGNYKIFREELVAVIVDRRVDDNTNATIGEFEIVTDLVKDGYLCWDVPEGIYRIYTITKQLDACTGKNDYVNLLEVNSVKLLLDTVYEPHYAHYKEEFGKTIAGFFSDEPGFYNSKGNEFDYSLKIGTNDMPVPWSEHFLDQFAERIGMDALKYLPCLWYRCGKYTDQIRYSYMDLITSLYQKNFSEQLGNWCNAHHVEYIGHVLEDGNVHARLGSGTGHYFRAMRGQHMAGIDVVLRQIVPGNDYDFPYMISLPELTDGEFYHYGLAKLGASAAHINEETKGRCMCEIFGAYGWSEGVSLMKWLTDFMLVRGVNQFVPHAFSLKEFPDGDCPPHFYAQGNNPQYKYMDLLFHYMNRMSHILNGGRSAAKIAVLYHAEGEWVGDAMLFQKVGKELMQNQFDYDVVSMDYLKKSTVDNHVMAIGNGVYECLIVPFVSKLPAEYIDELSHLTEAGVKVYFMQNYPESFGEDRDTGRIFEQAGILELGGIAEEMKNQRYGEISISSYEPHLRFYQYELPDMTVRMFHNENVTEGIDTDVTLKEQETLYRYDVLENKLSQVETEGKQFHLHLGKWESVVYVSKIKVEDDLLIQSQRKMVRKQKIEEFHVSIQRYDHLEQWEELGELSQLCDLTELASDFSGIARYEAEIDVETEGLCRGWYLDLGEAYEAIEVFINGKSAGRKICAPYLFEIGPSLQGGKNKIRIEVATTLFNAQKDYLSMMGSIEPTGILGPVWVMSEE